MLKLIKKYRNDPKRTVLTFSCQKKITLNRLGDLILKDDEESAREFCHCECESHGNGYKENYILENEPICNPLGEKKKQIEKEQAQILEKDDCQRAFKENYHIKPLEYEKNSCQSSKKQALKPQKEMRGGIVLEKSVRVLLCDVIAVGAVASLMGGIALKMCLRKR